MQKMSSFSSSMAAALILAGLLCVMGTVDALAANSIRIRAQAKGGETTVKADHAKKASSQKASPRHTLPTGSMSRNSSTLLLKETSGPTAIAHAPVIDESNGSPLGRRMHKPMKFYK